MQVAWALTQFPALRLLPAEPRLGACGRLGCGLTAEQVPFACVRLRAPECARVRLSASECV